MVKNPPPYLGYTLETKLPLKVEHPGQETISITFHKVFKCKKSNRTLIHSDTFGESLKTKCITKNKYTSYHLKYTKIVDRARISNHPTNSNRGDGKKPSSVSRV